MKTKGKKNKETKQENALTSSLLLNHCFAYRLLESPSPRRNTLIIETAMEVITINKTGETRMPTMVSSSMPPKTAVPMSIRLWAPAPEANINGTTPKINAYDVIIIGRSRWRPERRADSRIVWFSFIHLSRANSVIKIADIICNFNIVIFSSVAPFYNHFT